MCGGLVTTKRTGNCSGFPAGDCGGDPRQVALQRRCLKRRRTSALYSHPGPVRASVWSRRTACSCGSPRAETFGGTGPATSRRARCSKGRLAVWWRRWIAARDSHTGWRASIRIADAWSRSSAQQTAGECLLPPHVEPGSALRSGLHASEEAARLRCTAGSMARGRESGPQRVGADPVERAWRRRLVPVHRLRPTVFSASRQHLHKGRVILLGVSWGSVLGVHMVKARPDLFHAYVGTGQVVSWPRGESLAYAQVLARARASGEREAIDALEKIGPPPTAPNARLGFARTGQLISNPERLRMPS